MFIFNLKKKDVEEYCMLIIGLVTFAYFSYDYYYQYRVYTYGETVKAIITKSDKCYYSKRSKNTKTVFLAGINKEFSVNVSYDSCINYQVGDSLLVKFHKNYDEVFWVNNKDEKAPVTGIVIGAFILAICLFCFFAEKKD